jgi:hypothetical protein
VVYAIQGQSGPALHTFSSRSRFLNANGQAYLGRSYNGSLACNWLYFETKFEAADFGSSNLDDVHDMQNGASIFYSGLASIRLEA